MIVMPVILPLLLSPLLSLQGLAPQGSLVTETLQLSPPSAGRFGESIAAQANRVVVGAPRAESAFVYERQADGSFNLEATLDRGIDSNERDAFGTAVAIDDALGLIAVGVPGYDIAGFVADPFSMPDEASGAVLIYERALSVWTLSAIVRADAPQPLADFGSCLALEGDRLVVGARLHDATPGGGGALRDAGTVFVFERSGALWNQTAELVSSDLAPRDGFGTAVALSGTDLVVGAPKKNGGNVRLSGAAYHFSLQGGTWVEQAALLAPVPDADDAFGEAVAIEGDVAVVGAPFAAGNLANDGAVYAFMQTAGVWSFTAQLNSSVAQDAAGFGAALDMAGDRIAIGSRFAKLGGVSSGGVVVFSQQVPGVWTEELIAQPGDSKLRDRVGTFVALEEDVSLGSRLWTGAPGRTDKSGAAYLFELPQSFERFCFGDGGDGMGCTPCPCGNEAPVGSLGGCSNSVHKSGRLQASGQSSVLFDSLRFEARDLAGQTFGLLVSGNVALPNGGICPPGSGFTSAIFDGLRCVGQGFLRHGARPTDANGAIGETTPAWGPPNGPPGGLLVAGGFATAGTERFFQIFYRDDPLLSCGRGQNTTQAVRVLARP